MTAALKAVTQQRVKVRQLHDMSRMRFHTIVHAVSGEQMNLLYSKDDTIRFFSFIFAFIKVCHCMSHL